MAPSSKVACNSQHSCVVVNLGREVTRVVILSVVSFLFFVTSLLVNLVQLVNYVLFEFTWPNLRRYINAYLQDIILTQTTIFLELHCGVCFRLFYANQETKDKFGKEEHCLVVGNHRFQVDAFFYWLCCEMTDSLGAAKAYAKTDLLWMPIIGWAFFFGDFIFLRRNWKEDAKNIGPALDKLMSYPFANVILILPEGTRFTPEKYQAGLTYAKEHNIPVNFKYHLLPRVKGFASSLRHLQAKHANSFGVYNIQLVSRSMEDDPDAYEPTLENFFAAKPFKVDCFLERIDSSRLPAADADEETEAKFLYSVFEEKDELMAYHEQYHRFPNSIMDTKKPCLHRLARFFLLNFVMSGSIVFYFLHLAITTHSFALRVSILGIIMLVLVGIFLIISLLQNSNYGQKKGKKALGGSTTSSDRSNGNLQPANQPNN